MVQKQIAGNSLLFKNNNNYNYTDSYNGYFNSNIADINHITTLFLNSGPAWADKLMVLRDKIVGLFNLKTAKQLMADQKNNNITDYKIGCAAGIFNVYDKSKSEIILGQDDKHLCFRVSILINTQKLNINQHQLLITTVVNFNNFFGRLYFMPVKPFHKFIVKQTLINMLKILNNQN